jgi:hypothetical protein
MSRLRRTTAVFVLASLPLLAAGGGVAIAATTATPPTPTPTPATAPAPTPAPSTTVTIHHHSGNHTAALVLLIAVGLLLALGALIYAATTRAATEPEWLLRSRHATGEAGWRISNTWAEFVDFLRLGR